MVRIRVRICFGKQDDLRWVGHRDLMRLFERTFRRAELPLSRSEGFHPKPRMTFPLPLAVGLIGREEWMEVELGEARTDAELHRRLAAQVPPGLVLHSVEVMPPDAPKARVRSASYAAPIPLPWQAELPARIAGFLAQPSCPISRPHGRAAIDVRPLVEELTFRKDTLHMRLSVASSGSAGPREVLQALGLHGLEMQGVVLTRTAVEVLP